MTRDGQTIVFSKDEGKGLELWSIPARGGVALQLVHIFQPNSESYRATDISDDGKLVAYRHPLPNRSEIGMVSIDGKMNRSFNAPKGMNAADAKFSPCR
jgi:Tol biopolymer transport system component